jgi:hypothetical protein
MAPVFGKMLRNELREKGIRTGNLGPPPGAVNREPLRFQGTFALKGERQWAILKNYRLARQIHAPPVFLCTVRSLMPGPSF